jgi:hypothetical protein
MAIPGVSIRLCSRRINVHSFCSGRYRMTHRSEKEAVAQHLLELRRAAVGALQLFNKIADQLNFYERYLALSKNHDVTLTGQFIVIKGGRSTETTCKNSDAEPNTTTSSNLGKVQ